MNDEYIGFIGGGNMALATAQGLVSSQAVAKDRILIYEVLPQRKEYLCAEGFVATEDIQALTKCTYVFLAVKPKHAAVALAQFQPVAHQSCTLISFVTGLSTNSILTAIPSISTIRVMPNTPALVRQGMFAMADDYTASSAALKRVQALLSTVGDVTVVPTSLMDAVTAVSGSGPAYVFMFIDAMAAAGVKLGLTREQAMQLTLQTVIGAAEMVKQTGDSPANLKDKVCSPAGTTIEAVYTLEKGGFSGLVMQAMVDCERKSKELSAKG